MTTVVRRDELCAIRVSSVDLTEGRETLWLRRAVRRDLGIGREEGGLKMRRGTDVDGLHGWRWWQRITRCDTPGITVIRARASDRARHTQPEQPQWNRLGYGNNAIQEVHVRIRHPAPGDNPAARPAEGVAPSP
ncbi:hypothetical protein LWC33_30180 [Pseudonocardia sp. RS11V-5]|uniref:hypothetical protein n=1 Tax=Pseudonocardia terrae TaxID=2905831 RepID=UPI001E364698|nr:hypothetical protein [Pseudonocardia terrae]MCE3555700.1 hypothetical protein [Pseudonocardia terrae]